MTSLNAPIYLCKGKTAHTRFHPKRHSFNYGVTLVDIDVDRIDEADKQAQFFSVDSPNFVSINTRQRGSCGRTSLSDWAHQTFKDAGLDTKGHAVRLITFPRTEFFSFSPLSIWIALDHNDCISGLIYEVNNTFGERHSYVANAEKLGLTHEASKQFHVSPFFDVSGKYRFTMSHSADGIDLLIENIEDNARLHTAALHLKRKPVTNLSLMKFVLTSPLSGVGVMAAIHWEALRLFIKGMKYRPKPPVPKEVLTLTSTTSSKHKLHGDMRK